MAGGGNVVIIGSNDKRETQGASVVDRCLQVRVCNSLTVTPAPAACFEVQNCPATRLDTDSTLQLQDVDIVAGAGLGVVRPQRIPVSEYGLSGLPNLYFNLSGLVEVPGSTIIDPSAIRAAAVNAPMGGLSVVGGTLPTGPDRDTIVNLFTAEVFDNITTAASSALLSVQEARYLVIYIDLTESGNATDIRLIPQFSRDGGTNWFDWSVDQWVDLRYVPAQMPLLELIPLNYVVGSDFRLRAEAVGTTAVNTFTLSAWVEAVT